MLEIYLLVLDHIFNTARCRVDEFRYQFPKKKVIKRLSTCNSERLEASESYFAKEIWSKSNAYRQIYHLCQQQTSSWAPSWCKRERERLGDVTCYFSAASFQFPQFPLPLESAWNKGHFRCEGEYLPTRTWKEKKTSIETFKKKESQQTFYQIFF